MKNSTYDKLKWVAMIAVPAIATFVGTVGHATGWNKTEIAVLIITAVGTLLGSLLGVSNLRFKAKTEDNPEDDSINMIK